MQTPLSPPSLPPEVERFFAQQQEEQQKLNKTAHVKKNLRETQETMKHVMEKVMARNITLQMTEEDANALVDSSNEFLREARGMNWSCIWSWVPAWWCNFSAASAASAAPAGPQIRKRRIKTKN